MEDKEDSNYASCGLPVTFQVRGWINAPSDKVHKKSQRKFFNHIKKESKSMVPDIELPDEYEFVVGSLTPCSEEEFIRLEEITKAIANGEIDMLDAPEPDESLLDQTQDDLVFFENGQEKRIPFKVEGEAEWRY